MRNIWLLALANIRKGKGQAVSFFLLVMLAAILLNLGLIISLNYNKNFEMQADKNQSADVINIIQNVDSDYVEEYENNIKKDERIDEIEVRPVLLVAGSYHYGDSEMTRMMAVMNRGQKQSIGKISYIEDNANKNMEKTDQKGKYQVYLPWLFKSGGGYEVGDVFKLKVSTVQGVEKSFSYTVAGFFEETLLATINSTVFGIILEDKGYEELTEAFLGTQNASMFLVRLKDRTENEVFSTEHLPVLPEKEILSNSIHYDVIRQSRTVTSSIGSLLIVAFSMVIVSVMLVVVKFRIGNNIEEDMQNIGAQKAIGYTGGQILGSVLLQFLSVGGGAVILGTGLSYLLLPVISEMFAAQTGIVWNQGFDPWSAALAFGGILAAVVIVTVLSAKKIYTLPPIVALRTGIATHSFKRNYIPLDKAKGHYTVLLAGKSVCQNIRHNIVVGVIIAAISFAGVFAGVLYYNISMNFDDFLQSTVGELFDVQIECLDSQATKEVLEEVKQMPEVEKAFTNTTDSVQSSKGDQIMCYISSGYNQYDNQEIIYKGRFPKHENEVAIGGVMSEIVDKKPGDTMTIIRNGKEAEYLVTGLIQSSNFLGHDAALTEEGYRRLDAEYEPSIVVAYLKDKGNTEQFIEKIDEELTGKIAVSYDYKKLTRAALGSYQYIVAMLAKVIAVITAAIVALTLYLVIKTFILRKRKNFGIQKALGYTTRQLVIQTAFSFLPVVLAGAVLGNAVGYVAINPLLSVLFSGIGLMKVNYDIPSAMLIGVCTCITAFGFAVSVIVSARIRKITPYSLLIE